MHRVRRQLIIFDRLGLIAKWYDRKIRPGSEWKGEIDHHLRHAGVILLLVSPDFFASDYCYDVEMEQAIRQHEAGDSVVVPIILRPCPWQQAPFAHIQALPKDGRSITEWPNRDSACKNVADNIMTVVNALEAKRKAPKNTPKKPPTKTPSVTPAASSSSPTPILPGSGRTSRRGH